ncbi:MAG: hypothetical protein M0Z61_13810 [Nitrospiraceae bacterium]|nr:hypothetical protein [Nitrospiraceae bacterium]
MRKMHRRLIKIVLIAAVLGLPAAAFCAGSQFIPDTSIYSVDKGGLNKPEGVACSSVYEDIVVADTGNGRLMRYTFKGGEVKDETEIKVSQITYPIEVQMNSQGEIFVLDGQQKKIVRLSAKGKFEGYVDMAGAPDAGSVIPKSFKIGSNDDIYILDIFGARVIITDPAGKFQKQFDLPKDAGFITDLTPATGGKIILLDSAKAVLYISSPDGTSFSPFTGNLREFMDFPTGITFSNGLIYLVDKNGGSIALIGMDGSFHGHRSGLGWDEGLLYFPAQMCVESDGYAVIADRENNRVQIFRIVNTAS